MHTAVISFMHLPASSIRRITVASVLAGAGALGLGCGPIQELLTSPTATLPPQSVVLPDYMTVRDTKVCITIDARFPTASAAADALLRLFPDDQGTFFLHNAELPGDTLREQPPNLPNMVYPGDILCYASRGTAAYVQAHPTPTAVPTATPIPTAMPANGAWCKQISDKPDGGTTFATAWDAAQRLIAEHSDIPPERRTWYVRTPAGPAAKPRNSAAITALNKLPAVVHPDDAICLQVPQ